MQRALGLIIVGMSQLCPGTCPAQIPGAELPPGVSHLRHAKGGKGFDVFIKEALRESEDHEGWTIIYRALIFKALNMRLGMA
jgi:hypothetical protein